MKKNDVRRGFAARIGENKGDVFEDFWLPVVKDHPVSTVVSITEESLSAYGCRVAIERNWQKRTFVGQKLEQIREFFFRNLLFETFRHH